MLLSIITAILFRPSVLIFLGVLVAAAAGLFYLRGPAVLMKWVMDARVWLAIAGFATILAVGDLRKANDDLKGQVETQRIELQGKDDAAEVLERRVVVREIRTRQASTIREATQNAQPDEVVDATLDAISQVQDGGLDGRSKPVPERVRDAGGKAPDGNVVP